MSDNSKPTFRAFLRTLGHFVAILPFYVPGLALGFYLRVHNPTLMGIGSCMAALLAVLMIVMMVISERKAKRLKKEQEMSVRGEQEYYWSRREEVVRDLPAATRRLISLRRRTVWCWGIWVAVSLLTSFLCGVGLFSVIFIAVPMFVLSSLFWRIPPAASSYDFSEYTDPSEYPALHALAHRAAQAVGADAEIRILLQADCNAGIARIGKVYSLQIGVLLLDMLSEDELFQVLLHEFAHKAKEEINTDREYRLFRIITEREKSVWGDAAMNKIGDAAFQYADMLYCREYSLYRAVASSAVEAAADLAIIELGDVQVAANALAKINCFECYEREEGKFAKLFYLPEQPRGDAVSVRSRYFRQALAVRESVWRDLFAREITPRNATHPVLRERIAALGVTSYDLSLMSKEGAYAAECQRAMKQMDALLCEGMADQYAELRKMNYLDPLRVVEAWRAANKTVTVEEARPVIEALWAIGEYREAYELCLKLIAESDNLFATAFPNLMVGTYLLWDYDPAGIAHLYRAIELNKNFMDRALSLIGDYCCFAGWQEELDKFRERAPELVQMHRDVYSKASELKYDDRLVAEHLPEGMLEDILDYMMRVGEDRIERVFLMRKVITDTFFSSVFVISFCEGTSEEKVGEILEKIFLHLDNRPEDWQFSLFELDLQISAAVDQVPNCCVYDRAES